MFDPTKPPSTPIPAATVILLRERAGGTEVEVFLLRRNRRSTFMSDAFVFPGGKREPADRSDEEAAIRELYEEAGVLLAHGPAPALTVDAQAEWRRKLNGNEATFPQLLAAERLEPDLTRLHYWARWITPSVEPKRFDAQFYLAELPPGQTPSFDQQETVEEVWLTPAEAIMRHATGDLKLPPPQLKTMHELLPHAGQGFAALRTAAAARREHPHALMPRFAQLGAAMTLLLPWDPQYHSAGVGEGLAIADGHPLAGGPSRFVLEGMSWRLASASPNAD